jgi:hypothetical protein
MMQNLKAYVESRNAWAKIFKGEQLNLKSAADRQKIANMIDADLSPENLSCDGELPASQVRARYKNLMTVAIELKALDPSVKFYEYN